MSNSRSESKPFAMVRTLHGRPHKVEVLKADGASAVVTGGGAEHAIGYHAQDVYAYEKKTFEDINNAISNRDNERVAELWRSAKRYEPAVQ